MAASSSRSWRYDVFPSFSGEDVRRGFLSYLLKELERKAINSFIDNGIERSRPIGPKLLTAIRESKIAIVIFSKNYASSTWCLNELVEIHKCYKELDQMVIPVFYYVDPSNIRKQTGEFGKLFEKTCKGKEEDHIQSWIQALTDVANLAGEHLSNGPSEAHMVEKIANDVSSKLLSPSKGFGDFVGIEAHIETMNSILCLESEEARMIGIWGQSGIGKSTLGRALFTHLSRDFHFRNFTTDKPMDKDVYAMKLSWEQKFLSEILNQKDLKIENIGEVKKRLKDRKVLIVLDDVVNPEFLETLVGETKWFGSGSRIIVITQDTHILNAHKIDLLYEVKIPSQDVALKILCRSAFAQDSPPDDFKELAIEVSKVAGDLPLGLRVLGLSLKGRKQREWKKMLPGLQNGLKGDIMKTLKISYDRLDEEEQNMFLWIASVFNGMSVEFINDFFGDDNDGLERLAEKSLVRITTIEEIVWVKNSEEYMRRNEEIVEMHNLLEKLGREIVRAESKSNPGKRRFLTDAKEIHEVLTSQTGTEAVLGIFFDASTLKSYIPMDEKSFDGMFNLQFLKVHYGYISRLPNCLVYLPPRLKCLHWNDCPLKCLPPNFKAEFLVELRMNDSQLEKLWEGTQKLGSLKTIIMCGSKYLKEIPDLSKAINLETVDFSLCDKLQRFPSLLNSESLEYLNLTGCSLLRNFPQLSRSIEKLHLDHTAIEAVPCCIEMFRRLAKLSMHGCNKLKNISPNIFRLTNLKEVDFTDCGSVITVLSDSIVVATMEDLYENIEKGNKVNRTFFDFGNCLKLDRDARKLIIQSSLKGRGMILPGGEVPSYFKHRGYYGDSLIVTLPQSSLSQQFLRFNVCVTLIEHPISMTIHFRFNDMLFDHDVNVGNSREWKTNHLVLFSFKFRPTGSKLDSNYVEFKCTGSWHIKEVGIRLLNVSPSLDDSGGRNSETEYNHQPGEKCDVVKTERSNKQMQMTSSEEYFNLPCDQIVTDTGESSSVSSYPCLEGGPLCIDSMIITQQQDALIPIVNPTWGSEYLWELSSQNSAAMAASLATAARSSAACLASLTIPESSAAASLAMKATSAKAASLEMAASSASMLITTASARTSAACLASLTTSENSAAANLAMKATSAKAASLEMAESSASLVITTASARSSAACLASLTTSENSAAASLAMKATSAKAASLEMAASTASSAITTASASSAITASSPNAAISASVAGASSASIFSCCRGLFKKKNY